MNTELPFFLPVPSETFLFVNIFIHKEPIPIVKAYVTIRLPILPANPAIYTSSNGYIPLPTFMTSMYTATPFYPSPLSMDTPILSPGCVNTYPQNTQVTPG
jgi:hypothetical protein